MSVEPDLRSCQLKPGEYAVINFITVDAATNPIPLKSLIEHLRKCGSALRQINPRCPSTLVAEFPAGITVRAVIPAAANGGLFGPQDPQSAPPNPPQQRSIFAPTTQVQHPPLKRLKPQPFGMRSIWPPRRAPFRSRPLT